MNKIYNTVKSIATIFMALLLNFSAFNAMAELVNINEADAKALESNLSGIGPVKAQAIVIYRKKHGPFKSAEDIQNVPGIGKQLYNKNRNDISTNKGLAKAEAKNNKKSALKEGNKKSDVTKQKDKTGKKSIMSKNAGRDKKGSLDIKTEKVTKDIKDKKKKSPRVTVSIKKAR